MFIIIELIFLIMERESTWEVNTRQKSSKIIKIVTNNANASLYSLNVKNAISLRL